ncbi:alpha/beta-hydrolase [Cystobasidium minutum MCA 4210]|uniref:alpha/beta-hydrolase n=1 Tax=Cystobasidium minutum MCA 4210 TaxID=1397322 RepID=UPI0034CEAF01|eukprot:jgi/Rhomi1/194765/gm1.2979_g
MFKSVAAFAALSLCVSSLVSATLCPVPSMAKRMLADAPYTIPQANLTAQLTCIGGIENVKSPFLLVPGTGYNSSRSFEHGYVKLLGKNGGLGYDVCYVSPPPYSLNDTQTNAEYVANAIEILHSGYCRPFPVLGLDQGAVISQWVFTFWPSARRKISHFFPLAADFRGTTEGIMAAAAQKNETAPALLQQEPSSEFLAAFAAKGGEYNWVPTTSIFDTSDALVQPEVNNTMEGSTSYMGGLRTGNILIQEHCPNLTVSHGQQLYSNFTYQVVKLALDSPTRFASPVNVARAVANGLIGCVQDDVAPRLTALDVENIQNATLSSFDRINHPELYNVTVTAEPPLRDYIALFPDNRVHE